MKKHIIIIAMALISSYAMGQVDYNKKTDRFCLNSTLRYRNGKEINKDIIEMFKYAGNQDKRAKDGGQDIMCPSRNFLTRMPARKSRKPCERNGIKK